MSPRFLVARNPDPDSSLPYLLWLPLGEEGLVLKARETWPRTSKVYCHRAEGEWPDDPEIVFDVPVRSCVRRGVAVDLVLERRREQRSQFVFTRLRGGREAIFWQTARTTKAARPAVRLPGRRASGLEGLAITVDSRERYAYRFAGRRVTVTRAALPVGDYAVLDGDELVGVVERKGLEDLARSLSDGSLAFRMAELAVHPRAAVVVEERYSALFKYEHVAAGWLVDLLARHQARYPAVPIVFCETRKLAEEWTYRFLGAAMAAHLDQPEHPTAPRAWVEGGTPHDREDR